VKYFIATLFVSFLISIQIINAQQATIYGIVTDPSGDAIEMVNVVIKGKPGGITTNASGEYEFTVKAGEAVIIAYSSIGYQTHLEQLILSKNQRKKLDVILTPINEELEQVTVEDLQVRKSTLSRLDPKIMSVLPDASGNMESMIKTLPGVSSNSELSSQYSVRGGSYDENLVYVNDIEIYRPFLVRAGEEEGLSFINPDMVSSLLFSAGGFDAKYGDKLSSTLDIRYKKPIGWASSVNASLLGTSIMLQGDSKNHRFRHISGFRYKTTKYLLNSTETKGDYEPRFLDFQTYISYDLSDKLEVSFLGNYASNQYHFVPVTRRTSFGMFNQPMELLIYFEGNEKDEFITYMGALSLNYKVKDDFTLKLIASSYSTHERETFDILGEYFINDVDKNIGSSTLGDSVDNVGTGLFLKHGRNFLDAKVYSVEHRGILNVDRNFWQWGIKAQTDKINDNLTEWEMIDSAGYSMPYNDSTVGVSYFLRAKNHTQSFRTTAFIQDAYTFSLDSADMSLTAGIRANYWDFNDELVISPRASISYKPNWERDFLFKFATGYYYQPSFYKEMRMPNGKINHDIKAQKSIHFVLGSDYNFKAWDRPFKLVTELYYKSLKDLISYEVDNVRTIYSGKNDANGYAVGFDMKINGEFVKGVDSWFSFSLMKTEENIKDDVRDDGSVPGYIPRPSDQRLKISVFFQDYFPGNPDYKVHLQINFGSGLPFGPPHEPRYLATGRMKSYQRVDIGFSKILKHADKTYPKGNPLHLFKDAWISAEVLNLMDRQNVISYEWVSDYSGGQYAVENSLTGRRINLKLSANF
jgi:hypothetical protein